MIEKKPFVRYKTDEEISKEKYGRPFNVRLNDFEQQQLNKIKAYLDIKSNSTALKIAALSWLHQTTMFIEPSYLQWVFKKERTRLSDYEDLEKFLR